MTNTAMAEDGTFTPVPTYTPIPGTGVAGTVTPEDVPNLLPSPTSFTPNTSCPVGTWSPDDLDERWELACPQCLPPTETNTPGGFDVYTGVPAAVVDVPTPIDLTDFYATNFPPTSVPTLSGTATPTPTSTAAPLQWVVTFDASHGGLGAADLSAWEPLFWNDLAGDGLPSWDGTKWNQYVIHVGGPQSHNLNYTRIRLTFSPAVVLNYIEASGHLNGSSVTPGLWLNDTRDDWFTGTNVSSPLNHLGYTGGGTLVSSLEVLIFAVDDTGTSDITSVTVGGLTSELTPTPVPSASPSPTSTGTMVASPTPARNFLVLADCSAPTYKRTGTAVALSVAPDTTSSACYRVFPFIDIDNDVLVSVHIHVQAVDLCLDFYTPSLSIMGVDIDLQFFVTVAMVFLLAYWGLFN